MRCIPLLLVLVLTVLAAAGQQSGSSSASSQAVADAPIMPGTLIQAEILTDVDAKKAHPGDLFRARLWADVRNGDKIVLPQKTILVGHVVAAVPRTKDTPQSTLTVAFDKALLKGGAEIAVHGVVERVQLSPMAASSMSSANAPYNPGLNPGSTTNIAMPAAGATGGQGTIELTSGPTNIRDASIELRPDASGTNTMMTAIKTDVKLKRLATLDIRVTHSQ